MRLPETEDAPHKCGGGWERIEYRDNQYRFIEIFWCTQCGSIKRVENYIGGKKKISVRKPKDVNR